MASVNGVMVWVDNWEWVDDANDNNNAQIVGSGGCTNNNNDDVNNSYAFRCCFVK